MYARSNVSLAKGELESACLSEFNQMVEFDKSRQALRHLHEFLGEIDARYVAAMFCGKVARRAADSASDVEQAQSGTQVHVRRHGLCSLESTHMEFVDRRKIRCHQMRTILAHLL
jgi:hypothetical protein